MATAEMLSRKSLPLLLLPYSNTFFIERQVATCLSFFGGILNLGLNLEFENLGIWGIWNLGNLEFGDGYKMVWGQM